MLEKDNFKKDGRVLLETDDCKEDGRVTLETDDLRRMGGLCWTQTKSNVMGSSFGDGCHCQG